MFPNVSGPSSTELSVDVPDTGGNLHLVLALNAVEVVEFGLSGLAPVG